MGSDLASRAYRGVPLEQILATAEPDVRELLEGCFQIARCAPVSNLRYAERQNGSLVRYLLWERNDQSTWHIGFNYDGGQVRLVQPRLGELDRKDFLKWFANQVESDYASCGEGREYELLRAS